MKVLVLCGDSAHPTSLTVEGLAPLSQAGYDFNFIEDPSKWSKELMNNYSFVIFSKANNRLPDDSSAWAGEPEGKIFLDYVKNGNSILFLHSGTALYDDSPSLCQLMGGVFITHPPQCSVSIEPYPDQDLTQGFLSFSAKDEHYQMKMTDPDVQLFLKAVSEHGTQPAGWIRGEGKGKVCVLTPGHNLEIWHNKYYQTLLKNCCSWCVSTQN